MITDNADYIQCTKTSWVKTYDMISPLKVGGTFLINCPYDTIEEFEDNIPNRILKTLADKKINTYAIDA